MAALLFSQADSPFPGPADVVAAGMLIGAGVWWTVNQFTSPSTRYTTIADPGAGMRNLKTEDTAEEDKDVNGVDVPQEGNNNPNLSPDPKDPKNNKQKEPLPDGFKETKEFGKQHGQKVYQKGNRYYSKDVDSHNGGSWKVFEKVGSRLKRVGTADNNLNIFKR